MGCDEPHIIWAWAPQRPRAAATTWTGLRADQFHRCTCSPADGGEANHPQRGPRGWTITQRARVGQASTAVRTVAAGMDPGRYHRRSCSAPTRLPPRDATGQTLKSRVRMTWKPVPAAAMSANAALGLRANATTSANDREGRDLASLATAAQRRAPTRHCPIWLGQDLCIGPCASAGLRRPAAIL